MAKRRKAKQVKEASRRISEEAWEEYIKRLRLLSDDAYNWVIAQLGGVDISTLTDAQWDAFVDKLYLKLVKNGEAAAELSAELFEYMQTSSLQSLGRVDKYGGVELFVNDDVREVYKMVYGTRKYGNPEIIADGASRIVKLSSADTMLRNAIQSGAQVAWIPHGDTCAFCLTLASRGWEDASEAMLSRGHAEHIHANCDCTYAVRFDPYTSVEGYDPEKYYEMYRDAPGYDSQDKINAMRREFYRDNSEKINEQKRIAYAKRKERESSEAEEYNVNQ